MKTLFDEIENESPFNGARAYLTGTFSTDKRKIAKMLESEGAVLSSESGSSNWLNISKDTCVIIAGENPDERDMEKTEILSFDGYHIPAITEEEMNNILSGKSKANFPKPEKHVDITFDSLFKSKFSPMLHFNFYEVKHPLGEREIFIKGVKGNLSLIEQSLGNIGAYAVHKFDPINTDYFWLTRETVEKLKAREKDEFIQHVTNTYNSSRSTKFTYRFIIEQEAVHWMEYRARELGDSQSLDYLMRYQESVYGSF